MKTILARFHARTPMFAVAMAMIATMALATNVNAAANPPDPDNAAITQADNQNATAVNQTDQAINNSANEANQPAANIDANANPNDAATNISPQNSADNANPKNAAVLLANLNANAANHRGTPHNLRV